MDVFILVAVIITAVFFAATIRGVFVPGDEKKSLTMKTQVQYIWAPAGAAIVVMSILASSLYWIWAVVRPNVVVVYSTVLRADTLQILPSEVNVKFTKGCNVRVAESNPVVMFSPFATSTDLSFNVACAALNDVQQQEVLEAIKPFNGKRVLTTYTQARIDMPTFSIRQ